MIGIEGNNTLIDWAIIGSEGNNIIAITRIFSQYMFYYSEQNKGL